MNTKADSPEHPLAKRGSNNPLAIFVTALSAAICLAMSFGAVTEALAIAAGGLFGFGQTYLWATGIAIAIATLWLFIWSLTRAIHVEKRLRAGLDVDQPTFSIMDNLRGGTSPAPQE